MPNRIIKESICTSENLDNLSPMEEVFFYRLMVQADDFGRTDARPQIIRAKCFPLKMDRISNQEIELWLSALVQQNLVFVYQIADKRYLQFKTWKSHQQTRATKSKWPAPDTEGATMIPPELICNQLISDDINGKQMSPYSYSYSYSYSESKSYPEPESYSCPISDENSGGEKEIPGLNIDPGAGTCITLFEQEYGRPLSPMESDDILHLYDTYGLELVKEALRRAVAQGKRSISYIKGILSRWKSAGLKTIREVLDHEAAIEEQKGKSASQNGRDSPYKQSEPPKGGQPHAVKQHSSVSDPNSAWFKKPRAAPPSV